MLTVICEKVSYSLQLHHYTTWALSLEQLNKKKVIGNKFESAENENELLLETSFLDFILTAITS